MFKEKDKSYNNYSNTLSQDIVKSFLEENNINNKLCNSNEIKSFGANYTETFDSLDELTRFIMNFAKDLTLHTNYEINSIHVSDAVFNYLLDHPLIDHYGLTICANSTYSAGNFVIYVYKL